MIELLIFIFGAAVGSFLNVVICRLETEEGMVKGRSHCPKCGQTLRWHDLIPIVSFFMLRGRCRACKEKISWQYPIVEVAAGLLFLLIIFNPPTPLLKGGAGGLDFIALCFLLYVTCSLIVIFVYDLRHYIIPDVVLFPAVGAAVAYRIFEIFFNPPTPLLKGGAGGLAQLAPFLFSALGAAAFFLFLVLVTRGRGMGRGDVKLALLLGLILGWPDILLALFLAFCLGALVGLGLIAAGRKTMKSQIPFGPFLIAGTLLAVFFGPAIIDYYFRFFI